MPVISRGVSAEASNESFYIADNANDSNYANYWRSINDPPQWLAYDLSTIAAADKTSVIAVWHNSTGDYLSAAVPTGQPRDYTIEGNTGAGGGAAPAGGWTTLVTVTSNTLRAREHALNLSTYNWVRLNVSTVNGSTSNTDVVIAQWDLHNAAAGRVDDWLMLGDSITAFGAYYRNPDGSAWTNGPIAVQVNTAVPARFPLVISAGNGGENMQWCYDNRAALLTAFSGHYVAINHGTNDANQSGVMTGGQISSWYTALTNLVDYIASLGMVAVVGTIPWGNANGANQDTNLQALNAKIVQLYTDRPNVLRGPDQYSLFAANHNLIADGLHPTYDHGIPAGLLGGLSGYEWWQQNWRDTMLAIRTGTSITTPRQISGAQFWTSADSGALSGNAGSFVAASTQYLSQADAGGTLRGRGHADFTIAGWVYLTDVAAAYGIVGHGSANTTAGMGYRLLFDNTTVKLIWLISDGTATTTVTHTTFGNLSAATWYFYVVQYDSANNLTGISINGGAFNTAAQTTGAQSEAGSFFIGNRPGLGAPHNGRVDATARWNRLLTAGEIATLYNFGRGVRYQDLLSGLLTGLISWWDLEQISGTRPDSVVASANDLTSTNSVGIADGIALTPAVDGDAVRQWSTQVGATSAVQATGTKRPVYKAAIQNGQAVLRYDGVDDLLQAAGFSVAQPDTIFTVCKLNNAAALVFELGGATADQRLYWSNVDARFHISAGTVLTGTSAGQDLWAVKSVLFNGASSQLWNNGTSDLTGDAGANALTSLVIGAAGGGTNSLLGDIAEVIIFNRALTTTERRQVEAYLGAKYGITVV